MPFGSEGLEARIGLALSGGGFRASLFHLGSLWRLNELGVLGTIGRISSVSGGSITAGVLAKNWNQLRFVNGRSDHFEELVVNPIRRFCARSVDAWAIGEGLLTPFRRASDVIVREYKEHLFDNMNLSDLPDEPTFVFNSTNLQTGRSFRFTKSYMGDYLVGLVERPQLSVATAVAASSAFPPFLSPLVISRPGEFKAVDGAIFAGDHRYTDQLLLTDGGAYDNLGLETVWNRCRTVLVSDAGAPFSFGAEAETDWVRQTLRALDIATDQSRGLRKRALVDDYKRGLRQGAYWGIDTDIADYDLGDALHCRSEVVAGLASMRTRLDTFSPEEQGLLVNWGYAVCDAAVRSYGRSALEDKPVGAARWPDEQFPLDA